MIYGIQAAQPSSGGVGGIDYADATVVLDFELGVYRVNGVDMAVGDLISKTDTISASGLFINWNTDTSVPVCKPAVVDAIGSTEWTVLIDLVEQDTGSMIPLYFSDLSTGSGANDFFWLNTLAASADFYDQPDPGANRQAITAVGARPAIRRCVATRTNAKLSASVNGSAVVSDSVASSPHTTISDIMLGGDAPNSPFMYGYIERVIFYPPKADAALPALSTP